MPCPPRGLPLGVGTSLLANDRIHNVGASLLANYAIREQARSHAVVCQSCRLLATLFRNLGVIVLASGERASYHHALDVARTFIDLGYAHIAIDAINRKLGDVAVA